MTTTIHPEYRFYSFVAALYISPLQCGLQTAHAVSQMHADLNAAAWPNVPPVSRIPRVAYDTWAAEDKTIIICNALNSAGVEYAYQQLQYFVDHGINLPITIFHEDAQSLNGAATAAAVVVPEYFFNAKPAFQKTKAGIVDMILKRESEPVKNGFTHTDNVGNVTAYPEGSIEAQFIAFLKSYRLA